MRNGPHRVTLPSALRGAGLTAGVVLGAAACTSSVSLGHPPTVPTSTRPIPAASAVGLASNGEPTIGPGKAVLSGTVEGPAGPVGGATVEVERLVGTGVARAMVTSDAGGSWKLGGVLGGRYSVRAWLAPDLVQISPATFFLADGVNRALTLELASLSKPLVQSAIAPDPPVTGEPTQVVVRLGSQQVQADGTLTTQPDAGLPVQLAGGGWLISQPNPGVTDVQGQAVWTATCEAAGSQPLQAEVSAPPATSGTSPATSGTSAPGNQTVAIEVAPCTPGPPVDTTTTTSTTTTTVTGGTNAPTTAAGG